MTTSTDTKELKKEAKEVKREGWMEESKGQAQKWAGAITGNEMKKEMGEERQLEGNALKHLGKSGEHMADAAEEAKKAASPTA